MSQRGVLKLFFVFCLVLGANMLIMSAPKAVSGPSVEELNKALIAVEKGQYAIALPVLEQEAKKKVISAKSLLPLVTCYLATNQYAKAEKMLLQAERRRVIGSQSLMAELRYRTYRFSDAFVEADKALSGKVSEAQKFELERIKRASRTGVLMLQNVDGIQILDSVVVSKKSFIEAYRISKESGSLYSFASFFSKQDSTGMLSVYENEKQTRILYSKQDEKGRINLFNAYRVGDSYEQGAKLKGLINSSFNETFPFLLSDGITIYFSSNKEGGLGGYDLYVSRYNLSSDQYLAPENMGMPYSSIYNDYLLVIDEKNHLGWFASDRYQPEGKVVIYTFEFSGERNVISDPLKALPTAMLRSISSTWAKGVDYALRRQQIKTVGGREESIEVSTFRFVINDQRVYSDLSDFKKPEAVQLYQLYVKDEAILELLNSELSKQRQVYFSSKKSGKEFEELKKAILTNERSREIVTHRLNERAKEIRQLEISPL